MQSRKNALGEIDPAYRACLVHEKFGGSGDVPPVLASLRMQHSIRADRFRFGVRKDGESVALALAQLSRLLVGIDADRNHLRVARPKVTQAALETP